MHSNFKIKKIWGKNDLLFWLHAQKYGKYKTYDWQELKLSPNAT